jgi:hypothetical protein
MNVAGFVGMTDEELIVQPCATPNYCSPSTSSEDHPMPRRRSRSFWKFSIVRTWSRRPTVCVVNMDCDL